MSTRARILSFGLCGLLTAAGVICAVVVAGGTGQILALVLISVGLVCATSLVFLEVGLSEDRERTREQAAQRRAALRSARAARRPRPAAGQSRLGRARDHPRHLE